MLSPGESLDGYRILRPIGSGGFGEVWLCQSEALGDFRALKFIPATDPTRLKKEFDALSRYRTAAGRLRSPSIMPIEHVNLGNDGLFYIMPLADGYGADDPQSHEWHPLTLAAVIEGRKGEPTWLTGAEIKGCITPILHALQLLSDAGLVHRDVKPENILFLSGTPCLGDISLLGEDSYNITRRGTPGYSAPSWFVESGGQPDMYGAATTLYALLTGNPPDKMARNAFRWPPQGEGSLSEVDRREWLRLHQVIRRAVDERTAERFTDFYAFSNAISAEGKSAGVIDSRKTVIFSVVAAIFLLAGAIVYWSAGRHHAEPDLPRVAPSSPAKSQSAGSPAIFTGLEGVSNVYAPEIEHFKTELALARKKLTYPRSGLATFVQGIAREMDTLYLDQKVFPEDVVNRLADIKERFTTFLSKVPPEPTLESKSEAIDGLYAIGKRMQALPVPEAAADQYIRQIRPYIEDQVRTFDRELSSESEFRRAQMGLVLSRATDFFTKYGRMISLEPTKEEEQLRQSALESVGDIMDAAQHFCGTKPAPITHIAAPITLPNHRP